MPLFFKKKATKKTDKMAERPNMITTKLNLAKMEHVVRKFNRKDGTEYHAIIIPIENNNLFKSEKGNVFLDLVGFGLDPDKNKDSTDTHIVKQSLPQDVRKAMSEEEQRKMPILGNHNLFNGGGESIPNSTESGEVTGEDDLPF